MRFISLASKVLSELLSPQPPSLVDCAVTEDELRSVRASEREAAVTSLMRLICVVVVATVLPYIFYTKGLEGVESGRASIITNIEPVVETLVGVFVFKEALTVWTVLGMACVFGCVILLANGDKKCEEKPVKS